VNGDDVFVVSDVSGKGIPASLLQASARSLFRTCRRPSIRQTCCRASGKVFAENAGSSYLTCVVLRIDAAHHMPIRQCRPPDRRDGGTIGTSAARSVVHR
jgi:serine phosphatase RsbU (regulator of sigma subunit)